MTPRIAIINYHVIFFNTFGLHSFGSLDPEILLDINYSCMGIMINFYAFFVQSA